MRVIRIFLADDHQLFRDGLRSLLEKQGDFVVIAEAANGREAVARISEVSVDVVLMDLNMHELNGIEATRELLARNPELKVVALSMRADDEAVSEVLQAGASAYVPKESAFAELAVAVRAVVAGNTYLSPSVATHVVQHYVRVPRTGPDPNANQLLTPREREVLQLVAEGRSTKQIAGALCLSVKTVDTHRQQIMNKLDLHSVAELTKYAVRHGYTAAE
jgi:DNA-binding NarL/FixJ family response regulator